MLTRLRTGCASSWRAGCFALLFFVALPAVADDGLRELAADRVWRGLLHVPAGSDTSEILTDDFFLSPDGRHDPLAELRATVQAHEAPWGDDPDAHPRCRFPARYLWLASRGVLRGHDTADPRCRRLHGWARFERLRSVSLLQVSGYFGNPASSFGHALLRLNSDDERRTGGLLDTSVNFGALVPEGELVPVYVYKGLSGGYEAGFSDRFYFAHDRVYTRTEFRDVWDHELQLDDFQRRLLVLHLWEVIGRKFRYYFLTENCAWRIAELLELVTGATALRSQGHVWYAPAELFHRLDRASAELGHPLVRSVRFMPSEERALRHQVGQLEAAEQAMLQERVERSQPVDAFAASHLPEERQAAFLDVALAYYQFRLAGEEEGSADSAMRRFKDGALRARLALPPVGDEARRVEPPARERPASGLAPMLVSLGAMADSEGRAAAVLRWAAYANELAGFHGLDNGELVVMDARANLADGKGLRLEALDVIRVRKFNAPATALPGESHWSWQTRLGWRRPLAPAQRSAPLRAYLAMGAGRAAVLAPGVLAYAMLDAVAEGGQDAGLHLEPQLGVVTGGPETRVWLFLAGERDIDGRLRGRAGLQAARRVGHDDVLRLEAGQDRVSRLSVAWERHW